MYFKAARPGLDHDAGVTAVLARLEPRVVLAPLAVDAERGWMLLPDGGERLREVLARERHPRRWLDLLPRYAELQIASTAVLDELLACGLPDYRTPRLGGLAGSLAVSLGMAPPSPARLAEAAAELDAAGLPATVQHDDLHDGNVLVAPDGSYAVFDWGDSCASHPFSSLVVALRGVAHRFQLAEEDVDLCRLRDAYLEPWAAYATRAGLMRAVRLAGCVGRLCRSLAWWRAATADPGVVRGDCLEAARAWYGEFLEALGRTA